MRRSRKTTPLPVRDGVSPQKVFLPAGPWPTLLAFLCERFPAVDKVQWRQRMAAGEVVDGQGRPVEAEQAFRPNTHLYYYRTVQTEPAIPFVETLIYQDEHLLVVDKPHFLPTQPAGPFVQETLVARLRRRLGIDSLEPLHRLDRDTAGLVLFSVNPVTRNPCHALFREQRIQKIYRAIAPLNQQLEFPLLHRSRIERDTAFHRRREVAGPTNAETRIQLLQRGDALGLYVLQPLTGKTHQLRVHMAALGMPILNDPLYPQDQHRPVDDFSQPLQLLASELAFVHPLTGEACQFFTSQGLLPLA